MLDQLPTEIVEQILGNLPTASSIVNVACTNKKLHEIISANDHAIFRGFVQKSFPSIRTPPLWRDVTCVLTSRSRAWERRGILARECAPPADDTYSINRVNASQRFGYVPVIDSYEQWPTSSGNSRREVLAWGAAGRLRLRVTKKKEVFWSSMRIPEDHLPQNDILDIKLLRPHQNQNKHGESIIVRRANGEVSLIDAMPEPDNFAQVSRYISNSQYIDCIDISNSSDPLLAICNTRSLQLFPVQTKHEHNRAQNAVPFFQGFDVKHRKRCVKFLSDHTLAVGAQFVEGRSRAPIQIFDISTQGLAEKPLQPSETLSAREPSQSGRHSANVIATLDATSHLASRPGQVILSGWTDGVTRLHDLRIPSDPVCEYWDPVDDGQIFSLLPIGHESFLAGSSQNACLKTFDMRMSANMLSKTQVKPRPPPNGFHQTPSTRSPYPARKERSINIFLALTVRHSNNPWQHLPSVQNNNTRLPRYRGSIYSLSSPSPYSQTVYAGIENHVIQLDFQNTDDVNMNRGGMFGDVIDDRPVLNLSCYERPREGREATDPVLLRKQTDWNHSVSESDRSEEGWDERWRLPTASARTRGSGGRWRRGSDRHR